MSSDLACKGFGGEGISEKGPRNSDGLGKGTFRQREGRR